MCWILPVCQLHGMWSSTEIPWKSQGTVHGTERGCSSGCSPPALAHAVCAHTFLQWILEGMPSGRSGHAEIRGAVGNRFPKTCSLQLNPVLRSGILQEMPVGGDEIPLVQRSGAGHPVWESSSHKLISWDPGGHVRLIALLLPLICYPNNYNV